MSTQRRHLAWRFSSEGLVTDVTNPPGTQTTISGQQDEQGETTITLEGLRRENERLKQLASTAEGRAKASADEARKNSAAARRLEEIEDAKQSAEERLTKKAATAEAERDAAQGEVVRLMAALKAGLSPDDLVFLPAGLNEKDATEAATRLAARIGARQDDIDPPDLDGGPRGGAPAREGDWANAALRNARRR